MRCDKFYLFLLEEVPSGVSVGRTPSFPLCWDHEGKTECEILFGSAKGWLGHLGGVLAQATPISTVKRSIYDKTVHALLASHMCLTPLSED